MIDNINEMSPTKGQINKKELQDYMNIFIHQRKVMMERQISLKLIVYLFQKKETF